MTDKNELKFRETLQLLNNQLSEVSSELYTKLNQNYTSLHVIGPPRSGTTLLSQLIYANLPVGIINNLIAVFWKSPLIGIHLSNKLLGEVNNSTYDSYFGQTQNINEAHEFGYFWKDRLNYKDHLQQTYNPNHSIDWEALKEELYQMIDAIGKPLLFKSVLFGFHAAEAVCRMPQTLFIQIQRDVLTNAHSILKYRRQYFGNENLWISMKPHQYDRLKDESIYRQIIGQVYCLNHEYNKQLEAIPFTNKIKVDYEYMCLHPTKLIREVMQKINHFNTLKIDKEIKELKSEIKPKKHKYNPQENDSFLEAEQWFLAEKGKFIED